jgi:hypothetical protein
MGFREMLNQMYKAASAGSLLLGISVLLLAGCAHESYLTQQTTPDRAELRDKEIPVPPPPPHVDVVNPNPIGPGEPIVLPVEVTGTWTFTTPASTTRVERKVGDTDQFSIYDGRPSPTDTPIVVITVARDQQPIAASDPAHYKVANQREYAMNGNIVHEWTGQAGGAGFSELLIRRPGENLQEGETCHAMAIVKTPDQQKTALGILSSIVWEPSQ